MAKDEPKYTWNEQQETYEDFLARIPEEARQQLVDDEAEMIGPMQGLRFLLEAGGMILANEGKFDCTECDEKHHTKDHPVRKMISEMTENQCDRMIDNIAAAGEVARLLSADLKRESITKMIGGTDIKSLLSEALKDVAETLGLDLTDEDPSDAWKKGGE